MNNKLESYLTEEEKAVVAQAQEIMDKAMCRMLTDEMGITIEYVNEHCIRVDGQEMNEEEFNNYLQDQQNESVEPTDYLA